MPPQAFRRADRRGPARPHHDGGRLERMNVLAAEQPKPPPLFPTTTGSSKTHKWPDYAECLAARLSAHPGSRSGRRQISPGA